MDRYFSNTVKEHANRFSIEYLAGGIFNSLSEKGMLDSGGDSALFNLIVYIRAVSESCHIHVTVGYNSFVAMKIMETGT